jgi:hypothetical protein
MSHLQNAHLGSTIAGDICIKSENTLKPAIHEIKDFCNSLVQEYGGIFSWQKTIGRSELIPTLDKKCESEPFISPDGGLFFITLGDKKYCFLVVEDKYQGTNDDGRKRQSTGNAIERAFKNINASWHLFKNLPVSPYIVFTAGCDFHSCETIIHRIGPISNFGREPIVWEKNATNVFDVDEMTRQINISRETVDPCHATFCVKAHKWNEFPKGTSMWTTDERVSVMKHVVRDALKEIIRYHGRDE